MTSIRRTIKRAKKSMQAKHITINFYDKEGNKFKLDPHANKIRREGLAKMCREYEQK